MCLDLVSYLLGKKKGGGATPKLQTKSVTITENGTSKVNADGGYDGLQEVNITANVSGGGSYFNWGNIGYNNPPQFIVDDITPQFDYAKEIKDNWDSTQTDLKDRFIKDTKLTIMPLVDTSNAVNMSNMFSQCSNLKSIPLLNTANVTNMYNTFYKCSSLVSVPQFNTENVTETYTMFAQCRELVNVPVFNLKNVTNIYNMYYYCDKLSDDSVDNILQSCIGMSVYSGTKTLARMGFSSVDYPVSRIEALPHYQDFINAGWTIGY